jgi:hypothetical protein
MKIDHIKKNQTLSRAAELLRFQNKQMELHRMEEAVRQEKLRVEKLKPDDGRGQNVDVSI